MYKLIDSDKLLSKTQYTSLTSIESLDGLNSGVPTRTTSTLTPTTLRNIEQAFQECPAETHQNQARFVPPLVQPSTQVLHKSGSFMSVVDTKSWQGGRITESPHSVPVEMLTTSIMSQPRRNTGGRRPIKDKNITPEEEERRAVRRERNKLAAARCRKRRLDHTNELVMETEELQGKKKDLEQALAQLKIQKQELEFLLDNHHPCKLHKEIKTEDSLEMDDHNSDPLGDCGKENEMGNIPKTISNFKKTPGKRPTTLSVHSFLPATTIEGVPLTTPTPTSGIFNFDSLMEGGTGLTPVSGPLIPSCSTQLRNSGCVDLSSPDSGKLVSL